MTGLTFEEHLFAKRRILSTCCTQRTRQCHGDENGSENVNTKICHRPIPDSAIQGNGERATPVNELCQDRPSRSRLGLETGLAVKPAFRSSVKRDANCCRPCRRERGRLNGQY